MDPSWRNFQQGLERPREERDLLLALVIVFFTAALLVAVLT